MNTNATPAPKRPPSSGRPLLPGETKLLRIFGRRAALNYLAEQKAKRDVQAPAT